MFTLTVIGKYGPYPKACGATTCYLMTIGDKRIVLDMGSGALSKLQQEIDFKDIDAIILSHLHSDHMADMLVLRYALLTNKSDSIDVYLPDSPKTEFGLVNSSPHFNTTVIDESTELVLFGAKITFKQTQHPVTCHAIKIEYEGKSFVFSGDTVYDDKLIEFAKDCDIFLCDANVTAENHPDNMPHPSAEQAAIMAKKAGVKRLLLTHIHPNSDETDIYVEAKKIFDLCVVVKEMNTYYI